MESSGRIATCSSATSPQTKMAQVRDSRVNGDPRVTLSLVGRGVFLLQNRCQNTENWSGGVVKQSNLLLFNLDMDLQHLLIVAILRILMSDIKMMTPLFIDMLGPVR